jgi:SAM-dependent methyltransferase
MQSRAAQVVLREVSHFGGVLAKTLLYVYVPVVALLVLLHFPYDTDSSESGGGSAQQRSSSNFYEAAYRPDQPAKRGIDYEKTAAAAAKEYKVEDRVKQFVSKYGLQNKRVLDIGSGRGYLQDIVADYTGLDLSSKVAPYYHKPFVAGSATAMPFADNSFDAAWTVWVVEHIPQPEKAFEEMRRVLKPGGMLFLLVAWNCTSWAGDGFEVRPYEDFTLLGKLVKASIHARTTILFDRTHRVPTRLLRLAHYQALGDKTRLRYRNLEPNYDIYWQPDSDAAVSLDSYESMLWFQSRGDSCLSCGSASEELLHWNNPLIIKIQKPAQSMKTIAAAAQ